MKTKFICFVGFCWVVAVSSGCVGMFPVPADPSEVSNGRMIERRDVAFIVPGVTSRSEVERRLGTSSRHCDSPPAIVYLLQDPGWAWRWWILGPGGSDAGKLQIRGRHVFFVAFNDQGIVRKSQFANLSQRGSLDDKLEEWAR